MCGKDLCVLIFLSDKKEKKPYGPSVAIMGVCTHLLNINSNSHGEVVCGCLHNFQWQVLHLLIHVKAHVESMAIEDLWYKRDYKKTNKARNMIHSPEKKHRFPLQHSNKLPCLLTLLFRPNKFFWCDSEKIAHIKWWAASLCLLSPRGEAFTEVQQLYTSGPFPTCANCHNGSVSQIPFGNLLLVLNCSCDADFVICIYHWSVHWGTKYGKKKVMLNLAIVFMPLTCINLRSKWILLLEWTHQECMDTHSIALESSIRFLQQWCCCQAHGWTRWHRLQKQCPQHHCQKLLSRAYQPKNSSLTNCPWPK